MAGGPGFPGVVVDRAVGVTNHFLERGTLRLGEPGANKCRVYGMHQIDLCSMVDFFQRNKILQYFFESARRQTASEAVRSAVSRFFEPAC